LSLDALATIRRVLIQEQYTSEKTIFLQLAKWDLVDKDLIPMFINYRTRKDFSINFEISKKNLIFFLYSLFICLFCLLFVICYLFYFILFIFKLLVRVLYLLTEPPISSSSDVAAQIR